MAQEKEYFAFISYQRKDEEWADRLRSKLEHYRLPSSVRRQDASLPKEIRPIFRDALELAGGVLAKEIEAALQQSKFLIVICSPNSAKSPWVNKEIQTFIDLGREDRIIPFIIDGTPFSDNEETECFPPALRSLKEEKELLGININELSRDAAAVKVVARMFGLKFDALWQRYEREKKRRRWMIVGGSLLFALFSLGIGGYIAHQNQKIAEERDRANLERDRANSERDRAEIANASLRLANDSIRQQYALIERQKDSISHQKDEIAIERDNVKSANYGMKINMSKFLAEKASALVDDGESYLARMIALQAQSPNCPYTSEAERAIRKSLQHHSRILYELGSHNISVLCSPDNKYIATLTGDSVCVWDKSTGECITFGHHIKSASFSPDSKRISTISNRGVVQIWDVATKACIQMFNEDYVCSGYTQQVSFSPSGERIFAMVDYNALIWDVDKGTCICEDEIPYASTGAFCQDDSHIIVGYEDGTIRIFNYEKGECENIFEGKNTKAFNMINSVDVKNDYVVSASMDGTIRVWSKKQNSCIKTLEGHLRSVETVQFSPEGNRIVSSSLDGTIREWDVKTGQCLQEIDAYKTDASSSSYTADGKQFISTSKNGFVRVWDSETGFSDITLKCPFGRVTSASYSFDNNYIAIASESHDIDIWEIESGSLVISLSAPTFVNSVSFFPNSYLIAAGCFDNTVRVWDAAQGEILLSLKGHSADVCFVDVSHDGKYIASASDDKTIRIWNAENGNCLQIMKEDTIPLAVSFSPDNQQIVSATCTKLNTWDLKSGKKLHAMKGHSMNVNSVSYSPDGKFIVSASDDLSLRVWEASTGKCMRVLDFFKYPVKYVSYSPNGKYIVSASGKTVQVWNSHTFQCVQVLEGHRMPVLVTSFSPNNKRIMSSSFDKTIRIWDFRPLQELINDTRKHFKNRQLTPEERRKYYLE